MTTITISINHKPIPAQRPRFAKGRAYDPQADIKEETYWYVKSLIHNQSLTLSHKPLSLSFIFSFKPPQSFSKIKQRKRINQPHTFKPDVDNLVKFYMDCLTVNLFRDDKQVHTIHATKQYAPIDNVTITATYDS